MARIMKFKGIFKSSQKPFRPKRREQEGFGFLKNIKNRPEINAAKRE
jgi:hypothetical protein